MLSTDFTNGAWLHFPISVAAGGTVTIKVDKVVGANGLLNGLFLGGAGTPPTPLPPPYTIDQPGVKGDWVGLYGADGYVIGGWNGGTTDLVGLPAGVTYTVEQGARYTWSQLAGDIRAPKVPTRASAGRRAGSIPPRPGSASTSAARTAAPSTCTRSTAIG